MTLYICTTTYVPPSMDGVEIGRCSILVAGEGEAPMSETDRRVESG